MANNKNLIVYDDEYEQAKDQVKEYGRELEKLINDYKKTVNKVLSIAIKDKDITEALQSIMEQVVPLARNVRTTADTVSDNCHSFVSDIDSADQFLY